MDFLSIDIICAQREWHHWLNTEQQHQREPHYTNLVACIPSKQNPRLGSVVLGDHSPLLDMTKCTNKPSSKLQDHQSQMEESGMMIMRMHMS
jgi:hypothetical protein